MCFPDYEAQEGMSAYRIMARNGTLLDPSQDPCVSDGSDDVDVEGGRAEGGGGEDANSHMTSYTYNLLNEMSHT